jgi:protocatechuate 3,4-dioxygenase, beta subunit
MHDDPHPHYLTPSYGSTVLRAPSQSLVRPAFDPEAMELVDPVYGHQPVGSLDHDLTRQHEGEPIGERITIGGRVLDTAGRPLPHTLIEIWQANSAGRYLHKHDTWPAPLDPSFSGAGRCLTDGEGSYRFVTIKPGAYPWRNHDNAWRSAHIHFSLFGRAFVQRLVTQMYFPGDPLFSQDPIYQAVPGDRARQRMVSSFDLSRTVPEWALAYRFDIVLSGREPTPLDEEHG